MDVSNNPGVTGVLPPQLGLLSRLRSVRTGNTSMSCAGITRPFALATNNSCSDPDRCTTPRMYGEQAAAQRVCAAQQLLPCFLRFSEYLIPREDDSNMRCKFIQRRSAADARAACGGGGSGSGGGGGGEVLGDQAASLPDLGGGERLAQAWHVDPAYYQYQVCECLLVRGRVLRSGCARTYVCVGGVRCCGVRMRMCMHSAQSALQPPCWHAACALGC
jgi:hypothetical protein